jgi:glycosyltransferase involved in cell wall biosynthesis
MGTKRLPNDSDGTAPEVSVVMPCLNEAVTLRACIEQIQTMFAEHGISGEVVIGDNGSTDGSQAIAASLGARVVTVTRRGYGCALMGGIEAAAGRFVVMGDSDCSYDFRHVPHFLEKLRAGYDLVMGNRFRGGIQPGAMPPLHKYLGNPVLTWIGRLFFNAPCGDFHCGLRGFSKAAYVRMGLRTTGMEFASEMVVKATIRDLRIAEVPTTLSPDGRSRPPHLRSWRDGWRHLRFLLLFSPRWLFLFPGGALFVAGTGGMLWLVPQPRTIAGIRFDVNTLLYAAMAMLLGFQAMTFAFLTKIFAVSEGLMPEDRNLNRLFRYITLESGLVAGFGLIVIGVLASVFAVGSWGLTRFGTLDPERSLRLVIPAVLSLTLGCEVVFSSFFLSVLGMNRKDRVVPGVILEPQGLTTVRESAECASQQADLAGVTSAH